MVTQRITRLLGLEVRRVDDALNATRAAVEEVRTIVVPLIWTCWSATDEDKSYGSRWNVRTPSQFR
ncbi:MAG: hypothetical protein WB662_20140, partial [Methyloceanibacter sp.]